MSVLKLAALLSAAIAPLALSVSVLAQQPTVQTGTPPPTAPGGASPSTQTPEAAPQLTEVPIGATPVSLPVLAVATITGRVRVDADGDGASSSADTGAETLIELLSQERGVQFSILSSPDGTFGFNDVPNGSWELWIWWGPGFITGSPTATNQGLVRATVTVGTDGSLQAPPLDLLLKPGTRGAVPFPVRAGGAGQLAQSPINVRAAYLARFASLPSSGFGGRAGGPPSTILLAVVAAALGICLGAAGLAFRRRMRT